LSSRSSRECISRKANIGHFRQSKCAKAALIALATGVASVAFASDYFPLITTAEWQEWYHQQDEWIGETFTKAENLRSKDNAMPIIVGFNGNTFVKSRNIMHDDFFPPQLPRIDSYTDYSLTDEGLFFWGTKSTTYRDVSGKIASGVMSTVERVDWGKTLAGTTDRKVHLLRRTAQIGSVFRYEYVTDRETLLGATAIELILGAGYSGEQQQTQTMHTNFDVRVVFAGFDEVDGLYPGSYPLKVTPAYKALVKITETTSWGTSKVVTVGGFLDGEVEDEFGPTTATSVEWLVDGIGSVRSVVALGAWLDLILNAPIFDQGDGVTAAQDLETLVGYFDAEILRSGGGNILLAKDAVAIDGKVQLFGDTATPPPPSFTGFWNPAQHVGDNWFRYDPLNGLIYISQETQDRPYTGWIWYADIGWTAIKPGNGTTLNLYIPDQGWYWTSQAAHPYYYNFSTRNWIHQRDINGG
jgi:hypothetical protein